MISGRPSITGAIFVLRPSQICRVKNGRMAKLVANLAKIAALNQISRVTVPFFPWHGHC
jgi:hypothetical protein